MDLRQVPLGQEHAAGAIGIFNHYVRSSFAAFPEKELPVEAFALFLAEKGGLPGVAVLEGERLAGFAMLRPFRKFPAFAGTAEISIFLAPEDTGRGLGRQMLEGVLTSAGAQGIRVILAEVSSRNPASLRFHAKNGFRNCGTLQGVGRKFGETFDVVWMQRDLPPAHI